MAGIGIKLNKIYGKRTIVSSLYGIGLSVIYTIAPMLVIMGSLLLMYFLLGFDSVNYYDRELFSCTVLYIFIFSLLFSSAFNSVLSKYIADRNFEKQFADIPPCIFIGMLLKLGISTIISVPFYLWEIFVGKVPVYYVFTSYMCYMSLTLVFALMLYGVVIKQFSRISLFFIVGAITSILISCFLRYVFDMEVTYSMLLALTIGFWLTAVLELFMVKRRFSESSNRFRPVFRYLKQYWRLVLSDFLYILGLFCHNFVFWTVPWRMEIANTYVCNQPYDMATCLGMFTNLSATVLFVSKVEMHFFKFYRQFNTAIVGGSYEQIEKSRKRLFQSLVKELMDMVYIQFAISIIIFLLAEIFLPMFGFGGMTLEIYPLMAVGYFISFLMYSNILFLQYFTDYTGTVITGLIFSGIGAIGACISTNLPVAWYGSGFTVAALLAYAFSFLRMKKMEKNIYVHTFCVGSILPYKNEKMPNQQVYCKDYNVNQK
jgi:hypothetical protein